MLVTSAEIKLDTGRYLELVHNEDIFITENGKTVARLTVPDVSAVDAISGILKGKLPEDTERSSLRDERIIGDYRINA